MEEVPGQDQHALRILPPLPRHFLTGSELTAEELARAAGPRAAELKARRARRARWRGRIVALVFQKPSTRTRVSFEAGVVELGGHPMVLRPDEMQLSRGESVGDTARVLSRHVDGVGVRTGPDALLEELAAEARSPCSTCSPPATTPARRWPTCSRCARRSARWRASSSPTSATATTSPARWRARGRWPGSRSSCPRRRATSSSGGREHASTDPAEAVAGAHAVYADVWVSMGDEATADARRAALAPYRIDDALLDRAAPDAIALHCLPAHPGEEITAEVLYGARQRIWDQAENRRHAQKALLEWLLATTP